jgi:hypothetical protein
MHDNDKHDDRRNEIEVNFDLRRVVFRGPVAIAAAVLFVLLLIQQFSPFIEKYLQGHLVAPAIDVHNSLGE